MLNNDIQYLISQLVYSEVTWERIKNYSHDSSDIRIIDLGAEIRKNALEEISKQGISIINDLCAEVGNTHRPKIAVNPGYHNINVDADFTKNGPKTYFGEQVGITISRIIINFGNSATEKVMIACSDALGVAKARFQWILFECGEEEALNKLSNFIYDKTDKECLWESIKLLGFIKHQKASELLINALKNEHEEGLLIIESLSNSLDLGLDTIVYSLRNYYSHNSHLHEGIISSLGEKNKEGIIEILFFLANVNNQNIRWLAIKEIAKNKTARGKEIILKLRDGKYATHDNKILTDAAIECGIIDYRTVSDLGIQLHIEQLTPYTSKNEKIILQLGKIGNATAAGYLLNNSAYVKEKYQKIIIDALVNCGTSGVEKLTRELNYPSKRKIAANALKKLKSPPSNEELLGLYFLGIQDYDSFCELDNPPVLTLLSEIQTGHISSQDMEGIAKIIVNLGLLENLKQDYEEYSVNSSKRRREYSKHIAKILRIIDGKPRSIFDRLCRRRRWVGDK